MCPFRSTENIVLIVSLFATMMLLSFGEERVKDPKMKTTLKVAGWVVNLGVFGFVGFLFLRSRGFC